MTTPNLSMAELAASQSQPHLTHNSALRVLDGLVQLAVTSRVSSLPATSPEPAEGTRYLIVFGSPEPAYENYVAQWTAGAWQYFAPQDGWLCWVSDERALYVYEDASPGGWQSLVALP